MKRQRGDEHHRRASGVVARAGWDVLNSGSQAVAAERPVTQYFEVQFKGDRRNCTQVEGHELALLWRPTTSREATQRGILKKFSFPFSFDCWTKQPSSPAIKIQISII